MGWDNGAQAQRRVGESQAASGRGMVGLSQHWWAGALGSTAESSLFPHGDLGTERFPVQWFKGPWGYLSAQIWASGKGTCLTHLPGQLVGGGTRQLGARGSAPSCTCHRAGSPEPEDTEWE